VAKKKRLNCFNCAHFYITWDKEFPRGCKALSFKSRQMPSAVVFSSSGMECQKFEPKVKEARTGEERRDEEQ
jgi:hypothetical protein